MAYDSVATFKKKEWKQKLEGLKLTNDPTFEFAASMQSYTVVDDVRVRPPARASRHMAELASLCNGGNG